MRRFFLISFPIHRESLFAQDSMWTCRTLQFVIPEWSLVYLWLYQTLDRLCMSIGHMFPHCNLQQMDPLVNTIVSDFAYITPRENLQVNTACMWTDSDKQWPQPFSWRLIRSSIHPALAVSGHLGLQTSCHLPTLHWLLVVIWVYKHSAI